MNTGDTQKKNTLYVVLMFVYFDVSVTNSALNTSIVNINPNGNGTNDQEVSIFRAAQQYFPPKNAFLEAYQ